MERGAVLAGAYAYYLNDQEASGVKADSKLLVTVTGHWSIALEEALLHLPINESIVKCDDLCSLVLVMVVVALDVDTVTGTGFGMDCAFSKLNPKEILANSAGGSNGMAGGNGDMYGYGP